MLSTDVLPRVPALERYCQRSFERRSVVPPVPRRVALHPPAGVGSIVAVAGEVEAGLGVEVVAGEADGVAGAVVGAVGNAEGEAIIARVRSGSGMRSCLELLDTRPSDHATHSAILPISEPT